MGPLVTLLGFCVVALLVYVTRWSGRMRATGTRVVAAPLADVRARIVDLHRWAQWNPWLEAGGEACSTCTAVSDAPGSTCSWSRPGDSVATVENRRIDGHRIEQRLRFREPFAFRAGATWSFVAGHAGTVVTWSVRGRVAFPLRAFSRTVQAAVALDLRYGLDRLAGACEEELPRRYAMAYPGVAQVPARRYAYRAVDSGLGAVAAAVDDAAAEVGAGLARSGIAAGGEKLAVYLRTDVKRRTTECRVGITVAAEEALVGLPVAEMRAHRAFVARLTGEGASRELAWYLAMRRMRAAGLHPDLALPPFERHPCAAGHDAPIELCIPVRPDAPHPGRIGSRS